MSLLAAAIIGAGSISAGGSILSGKMSSDSADEAAQQQYEIARRQLALAEAQWDRYKSAFLPIEDYLIENAQQPYSQNAGYLSNLASLEKNSANTTANLKRTMGGRYQYGSGLEQAGLLSNMLNRNTSKAQLGSTYEQNRINNLYSLANLGRGLTSDASNMYSSVGNTYGNLANMYSSQMNNAYNTAGNTIGSMLQLYLMSKGGTGT